MENKPENKLEKQSTPAAATPKLPRPHKGLAHWWLQRVSAVLLIPFTLWFVSAILAQISRSHFSAVTWLADPWIASAFIAYLPLLFVHAQLGIQVIIEDYVSGIPRRCFTWLMALINLGCAGWAIYSVLRIATWV